jgi:hypothetical protein
MDRFGDDILTRDRQEIRNEPVATQLSPTDGEVHKIAAESQGDGETRISVAPHLFGRGAVDSDREQRR